MCGQIACIYAIVNVINDKQYVGQTFNKLKRFGEHKKTLRAHTHCNRLLQRAFNKYGEEAFIFVMLEEVKDLEKLTEKEQCWIDTLKPEYNLAPVAGSMLNYKHTDEARQNMSKAHIGKIQHSEEYLKELAYKMKGNKWNVGRKHSLEHIETRAKVIRGVPKSDEHRAKIAAANKGQKRSEETRLKMSLAKRGKKLSDSHKQKLSEAAKRQWGSLTEV